MRGEVNKAGLIVAEIAVHVFQAVSYSGNAKPIPLMEAARTRVDRTKPKHVHVRAELVVWKNLPVEAAVGPSLDHISHFLDARVHRMGVRNERNRALPRATIGALKPPSRADAADVP